MATRVIAVINNAISARLTRRILARDGIALAHVALIMLRDLKIDWAHECASVLRYPGKPAPGIFGQWRFIPFFAAGARLIRRALRDGQLAHVYLVNNDNLLTSPFFSLAETGSPQAVAMTVVAEGIMNYQQIDQRDRSRWRWLGKPLLARLLGLAYSTPRGHLSGAYQAGVQRVISFSAVGLKAPPEKVLVLPFSQPNPSVTPQADTCLIVHTGLWQWMDEEKYQRFAQAFVDWLQRQGFKRILTKVHPHVATGVIEHMLPTHEQLTDPRSVEAMAADIPAATVLGTCCTALVSLKLLRPDLRCVDFGADYYCEHAYHGDRGVIELMRGTGVEVQPANLPRD